MTEKSVDYWTRKEFEALPCRRWNEDIGSFDSLVILPQRTKHDSGFRCMDFVAVKDNKPFIRLAGCSDVIHLDGIGGYGLNWFEKYGTVPVTIPPVSWNVDCLPTSGLLRIFTHGKLWAAPALSSFEIYAIRNR
jgi:hypothetical protein